MSEIKTASGSIVTIGEKDTITDVKSLTVDLEPIQDLNGYDKPWVGGAGKNLLDTSSMSTATASGVTFSRASDGTINVGGKATANVYRGVGSIKTESGVKYILTGCPSGGAGGKYRMTVTGFGYDYGSGYTFTGDGNTHDITVDIYTGYPSSGTLTFKPMIRLASETDATYEPYSNVCPISGHDSVDTNRVGKNLLPVGFTSGTSNGVTLTNNGDGTYTVNGTATGVAEFATTAVKSDFYVGKILTGCPSGGGYSTYRISQQVQGSPWTYLTNDYGNGTTLVETTYEYIRFLIRIENGQTVNNLVFKPMVRLASETDGTFEPYQGTTHTTDLGRTVYGGTLDVTSGVLTVTHGYALVNGNVYGIAYNGAYPSGYKEATLVLPSKAKGAENFICDRFRVTSNDYALGCAHGITTSGRVYFSLPQDIADTASVIAWFEANPTQVVYELATPQTYQLTAQQIDTLLGVNSLWASAGDITVKYTENILMNESVSINGKYLEAIIDGYLTLGTSGRRSLGRELDTYSVGSADGETVKGDRFPSRKIKVNYVIQSDSEEELINSVNQLNNILNQDEADFIFRDEPDKFFTGLALLDAEPKKYRHAVKGTWTLYCAYPFKRSVEPITLVSTTDASISGNTATFVFDYNGTRPARPVLRARFASAKSGGDYTEDGDCGFVAFVDGDEHIIQLGNPDVIDVDAANKNEALVNSELDAFTGWTNSGKSITSITDQFWENGKGQTQNYASGNGYIRRNIASTIGFEYDMVHRLCVSDPSQIGTFKVLLKNGNKTVVGFSIEKTGSGTGGTVKYIINDKVVGTDNIDLSYYNPHFGYCNRSPVYVAQTYYTQVVTYVKKKKKKKKKKVVSWVANTRWVQNGWSYTQSNLNSGISRDGGVVTFSVGELADRTFKSSDIDTMACTSLSIESTGSFNTNAVRSVALVRKAGVPFAEIPNVFTSGDIVEGDCNSANVYLHRKGSTIGHLEPQYGALGNDWEDFELKPGRNAIRAVWSNWVNANYKPVIEITYNEVFL